MSRKSSIFAEGPQKFTWSLTKFTDASGRERYKAQSQNYPKIFGLGDDEQTALRAGQQAITKASETAELGTDLSITQKL